MDPVHGAGARPPVQTMPGWVCDFDDCHIGHFANIVDFCISLLQVCIEIYEHAFAFTGLQPGVFALNLHSLTSF